MAITTQDALVSGLATAQRLVLSKNAIAATANRMTSLWTATGIPTAGSISLGQSSTGVIPTSATTGALPFTNPTTGNSYLAGVRGLHTATGTNGILVLFDILWIWGSTSTGWNVTTTTNQNAAGIDVNRPDNTGAATELWFEVLSTMGAGSPTPTITYTNSSALANRSASTTTAIPSASATGSMFRFQLQAGDTGVRSVQILNLGTSMTSGTARIMIVRRVAEIPVVATNIGFLFDAYDLGLARIYNDACLMAAFQPTAAVTATTVPAFFDTFTLAQG
jgi:hypothetical protein